MQTTKVFKTPLPSCIYPVRRQSIETISMGSLEVRLAKNDREIEAAQRLRYKVFYEEMGALPDHGLTKSELDADKLDQRADHLIVFDRHSWIALWWALFRCCRHLPIVTNTPS